MASFQPITGAVDNGKSYNMERVLRSNVLNSTYFTQLCKVEDFMDLVDEIYNEVDHVEPWMSGNARGPSTAFCLLYRLFTMELDDRNINHLINHRDSPYIRALGFLYVRYVRDPKEFGRWFDPFFKDDEEFAPMPGGKNVTIGAFVRDLVLDQYYFETIFPRCPEVTRRRLVERVVKLGYDDKPLGCGGCGGSRRAEAPSGKRPPSVKAALSVNLGQRAPHVAGVTERGRGLDPSRRDGHDKDKDRDKDKDKDKDKDRDRDRDRDRDKDRDRDRDRHRDRSRDVGKERRRSRSRDRAHPYGRDEERNRRDRDGSRDRAKSRKSHKRDGSRDRDRGYGGGYRKDGGSPKRAGWAR